MPSLFNGNPFDDVIRASEIQDFTAVYVKVKLYETGDDAVSLAVASFVASASQSAPADAAMTSLGKIIS